ncbi:N-acyl-D-aspartate/D-glutamate deacylase [Trujillonella endophytica]|uniref:N-acyl-D-aspartate/D-glutamate deacylase n=1 Tax=Trujillonella endophytica TaxID=673521 RepID=A0A1H8SXF8_9ACTN|nr:N-acyl-D-aspartate/D-glutamate deacylase [Trujillella endophytica]
MVDGTGAPARTADVAVDGGVVVEVGVVSERGRREIDADGALVTPGFVDMHTHYDGQATWDSRLQPSAAHGVTTVVMGNCGVGFAPVRERDRDRLVELMEGVEELPGSVLNEGLPWTWETFEEYLDVLDARRYDVDVAAQVCHAPLRVYVMGQRGADREAATAEDIAEMARLAAAGIEAGALGFSTSRTLNHRSSRGDIAPTKYAEREELVEIARAIGATGRGVLQVVTDFDDHDAEIETMLEMMRASGRPLSLSLGQTTPGAGYRRTLRAIERARDEGLLMTAGVPVRAIGVLIDLEGSVNPWRTTATFRTGADLRDPEVKRRILAEMHELGAVTPTEIKARFVRRFDAIFEMGEHPDYEPATEDSVGARAAREGRAPEDLLYDILLEGPAYQPVQNYFGGNLDAAGEMLSHPYAVPSLSDGGAHVGTVCDVSFPTTLLSHWVRDRTRGPRFELEWAVSRHTRATAAAVGLTDRGLLVPGAKGDLNVIDFERLAATKPTVVADLPAGGRRVMQGAQGYLHTLNSGVEVYADGEPTGELPGRLVRGGRIRSVAAAT